MIGRDAQGELAAGLSVTRHYGRHGEARARDVSVFIESFAPPPRMIIFGAVDFTAALAKVAKILGYRVTVCDARPVFATRARFPMADEVVVAWPDKHLAEVGASLGPRDAVCVLTHDPKFDVPAIMAALATDVGYLGAMGSRRTHTDRTARLLEAGVDEADLDRVMGPIGLDIGARTPEETAVAICAEIIAHAHRADRPVAPRQRRTDPPRPRRRRPPGVGLSRRVGAAVLAAGGGSRFSSRPGRRPQAAGALAGPPAGVGGGRQRGRLGSDARVGGDRGRRPRRPPAGGGRRSCPTRPGPRGRPRRCRWRCRRPGPPASTPSSSGSATSR